MGMHFDMGAHSSLSSYPTYKHSFYDPMLFYSNGFEWIINESIVVEVLSFIIIGLQWLLHDVCMASTNVFLCSVEDHHSG